jgi:hypothetical protein
VMALVNAQVIKLYWKCAGSVEIGILACCFELVVGGSDNQCMGGRSSHRCSPSW